VDYKMHFISMFYKLQMKWLFKIDLVYGFLQWDWWTSARRHTSVRADGIRACSRKNMMWIKFPG